MLSDYTPKESLGPGDRDIRRKVYTICSHQRNQWRAELKMKFIETRLQLVEKFSTLHKEY